MAYRSSINTATINKSVGTFRQSLGNAQKSASRVNSSLMSRNKFKKESISKRNSLFSLRRAAVRRKESEDAAEATTALGVRRAPSKIASGSTRSFFGRMMDISGALLAGWLVGNLPNIINLAEATTRRAIQVSKVLSGAVTSFTDILTSLLGGLGIVGSNILRGDINSIPNSISNSAEEIKDSFYKMYTQMEEAYKVLTQPLDFSEDIEELRQRLGLEVPSGEPGESRSPGTPGTGGRLQPIHKQALDIISGPESGGNYNAMNQGTDANGKIVGSGDSSKIIGKPLTSMTIGEVMDRQNESKYPRSARPDRGIHAAGRYQIIGSTMISAVKLAGLSRSDKFDEANQDLLGIAVLKSQGIGAWTVGGSRYTAAETAIVNKAKNTPLGQPTATVQPGKKYTRDQNITSIVGAKGTPAVIVSSLVGDPRKHGPHGGIDIATDSGVYIALRANGVVVFAGSHGNYGLVVDMWIESEGVQLRMAHCSAILPNCKVGAVIPAGVSFARVGSTGESTGPHIHFEVDTKKGGTTYGGNTPPDPYVALLLLTSRQSNGFKGVTSVDGKPLAKIGKLGTGGSPEAVESLTPERRGQTVIVSQQQPQQAPQMPMATKSTSMPSLPDNSLNNLRNNILLTHLAYT